MILSADQMKSLSEGTPVSVTIDDEECVVLQKQAFDRLTNLAYDDSEMDVRELHPALADLSSDDWEDAAEYEQS